MHRLFLFLAKVAELQRTSTDEGLQFKHETFAVMISPVSRPKVVVENFDFRRF